MPTHIYQNPDQYSQNNLLQYNFAMQVLKNIEINKKSHVLDIGCGDGKITIKIAEMASEGSVIGTDISDQMVEHATKTYHAQKNLSFKQMDASKNKFINQFDLITSFNCLHWVKDQDSALRGIVKAAVLNAKVVLLLSHKKSVYHYALDAVCDHPKWQPYFKNYVNPRSFFEVSAYENIVKKAGLDVVAIDEQEMTYNFDTRGDLIAFFDSAMANIKQIPQEEKEDFLKDFCEEFLKHLGSSDTGFIPVSFWCLIVKAIKQG